MRPAFFLCEDLGPYDGGLHVQRAIFDLEEALTCLIRAQGNDHVLLAAPDEGVDALEIYWDHDMVRDYRFRDPEVQELCETRFRERDRKLEWQKEERAREAERNAKQKERDQAIRATLRSMRYAFDG